MIENLKEIKSSPITGSETLKELLKKCFTAHLSRDIRDEAFKNLPEEILEYSAELKKALVYLRSRSLNFLFDIDKITCAYNIFEKIIKENYTIFLVFAGALTPADFGTSCLIPLIERRIIDAIITTGANVYHEIQRVIGCRFYEYNLNADAEKAGQDDLILAGEKYSRIYNIIFPERDLFITDDFIIEKIFPLLSLKEKVSFTDYISAVALALGRKFNNPQSWLMSSYFRFTPVFCGAPQDSSLFFPSAFYELIGNKNFDFDIKRDVNEMAALQHYAQSIGKIAIIILGGGVQKNFTLQVEPYLKDICGIKDTRGFDADIQISMADVRDGGLSSCPASEGHTWGKVSESGVGDSIYIKGEILSIFPLLVYEICRQDLRKEPKRLMFRKHDALNILKKAVEHRKNPMIVQEYDELINK